MLPKIVVISKNTDEQSKLKTLLTKEGFEVLHFSEIKQQTIELISNVSPHIILLEMDLEESDGIEVCYQLKMEKKIKAFIVINSSQHEEYIQIEAFKAGADDYIVTPISNRVLIKRINALIKRTPFFTPSNTNSLITHQNFVIDRESYAVLRGSEKISLPKKEFEMLCLLFKNPQKIYSRNEIYLSVWNNLDHYNSRIIDVHIRKIREKLGDSIINTIKGVGYQLASS
jgi:two-component system alkaline phosphatase synthesis response regulator PhoP